MIRTIKDVTLTEENLNYIFAQPNIVTLYI